MGVLLDNEQVQPWETKPDQANLFRIEVMQDLSTIRKCLEKVGNFRQGQHMFESIYSLSQYRLE